MMSIRTRVSMCFLALLFILAGCRKDAFDEIYGRPDDLAPPIYQVLQSKGNFTNLLACIDKSGYKPILNASGYWTFFAPNDAAFQKYFTANNTSIDKIDEVTARKIVTYGLVYNAFQTNHIADYQSPSGWVPNNAYKRRTAYYDSFYTGPGPDGASTVLLSQNRNSSTAAGSISFVFGDENNKYIPYFYNTFMQAKGLQAADYNFFYPNTTYTGFNVANTTVVNKDITAENGVIHEIDGVILPLPSLEQKLASSSDYSNFRNLFEKYMILYGKDDNATKRYLTQTGKSNSVYIKVYSGLLGYAPSNETYAVQNVTGENVSQTGGYSLFAPTNAAFNTYLGILTEFYGSVDALPQAVIADFLNAHMWQSDVWPSKFATSNNVLGEPARFNSATNVVDKQVASNGIFYGVNKVQEANVFSSVYARAYLDPAYSIMTRLLDFQNARLTIANPGFPYTLFMLSDATLRSYGYDYNTTTGVYSLTVNGVATTGDAIRTQLLRILNEHIVPENVDNLAGSGIAETNQGEYIRWSANKVWSAGTVEKNQTMTVTGQRQYANGKIYYLSAPGLFESAAKTVANGMLANATLATDPYYDFYKYITGSGSLIYNTDAAVQEIIGLQLGASYTVLVPTQAAMRQAVIDGYLPGTVSGSTVTFNYAPTLSTDKDKVVRFVQNHIINGIQIAADGKKSPNGTAFPTLLKNSQGDVVNVNVFNQSTGLRFEDINGRAATVTAPNNASYFPATSNYVGNRVIFHQINTYLQYKF